MVETRQEGQLQTWPIITHAAPPLVFLVQVMSPLSCAQLFKSRVKGGHRQLDKQPTPRQIASLFGAPLANMLHMFRGSLAAGAILFFFCPAAQPPNPKRFIDRSRRFQPLLTYSLTVSTSCLTRHLEPCSDATLRSLRTKGKNRISIAATRLVQKGNFLASSIHYVHTK